MRNVFLRNFFVKLCFPLLVQRRVELERAVKRCVMEWWAWVLVAYGAIIVLEAAVCVLCRSPTGPGHRDATGGRGGGGGETHGLEMRPYVPQQPIVPPPGYDPLYPRRCSSDPHKTLSMAPPTLRERLGPGDVNFHRVADRAVDDGAHGGGSTAVSIEPSPPPRPPIQDDMFDDD